MGLVIDAWLVLVVAVAGWMQKGELEVIEYLRAENRVLREQLRSQGRTKSLRFTDDQRRRLAVRAKVLGREVLRKLDTIVTPDTLLRWHRQLIAKKYDGTAKRGPGRPRVAGEIEELIVLMAMENPSWGYTRIVGALANLGHEVGRTTVADVLARHGVEPSPARNSKTTWRQFLRSHWETLAAADFFTVEVWSAVGLVRYHVLFVMRVATRRVHIAGIVEQPHGEWMEQVARNLTDAIDGFLVGMSHLIHDRDPLFTKGFGGILNAGGVEQVKLPPQSPDLNPHAERFVLSIKSECLDRLILLSEAQLRRATSEYVAHYHAERNHQGLGNRLIDGAAKRASRGPVRCRSRLGGLLNYYHREAA